MVGRSGKIGNYDQVKQITGVRYKKEHIQLVVNMFQWEEKIATYLNAKNTAGAETLVAKQHRMVCYFFEKLFDLMIGLNKNLSKNPGFECFVGKWGNSCK